MLDWGGPKSNSWCLHKLREVWGHTDTQGECRVVSEVEVMELYMPKSTKDASKQQKLGRWGRSLPESFQREHVPADTPILDLKPPEP